MYKMLFSFFGVYLFLGLISMKVEGQNKASASAYAMINNSSNSVAKIQYLNDPAQKYIMGSYNDNTITISPGTELLKSNYIYKLASFSITVGDQNSFFVSLPTHPISLTNTENDDTVQVSGWQAESQSEKTGNQKNLWKINLGGFLQIGTTNELQTGVYSGTYPVTFVYN